MPFDRVGFSDFALDAFWTILRKIMHDDLSGIHQPIEFSLPDQRQKDLFAISDEQVAFFDDNGYLADISILDESFVAALCDDLERLMQPEFAEDPRFYEYHQNEAASGNGILFHALGAWRVSIAFHDLVFHPAMSMPASQLLRGPVRLWHDQVFVKPKFDGGVVAWHQDYSYWTRTRPMAHLTCWIGLDDSNEENGCVHYIPGSHKWNLLPRTDLANDMDAVLSVLSDEQRESFKPVPMISKAGHASFHHPLMLHGSFANRSPRPRRAAVINFIRDGVVSDSDLPLLDGVPPVPVGDKIEGRFFPLLSELPAGSNVR